MRLRSGVMISVTGTAIRPELIIQFPYYSSILFANFLPIIQEQVPYYSKNGHPMT